MSEPFESPPPPKITSDLQRFREYFTAAIALILVAGFIVMVFVTSSVALNGSEDTFGRTKDLLLFLNPIVGMVIGYYFNKTTSEARAEKAEANVEAAAESAQTALKQREKAMEMYQSAEEEIKAMRGALGEVWLAAEEMLKEAPASVPATRGEASPTLWKLQEALKRAEKWT